MNIYIGSSSADNNIAHNFSKIWETIVGETGGEGEVDVGKKGGISSRVPAVKNFLECGLQRDRKDRFIRAYLDG